MILAIDYSKYDIACKHLPKRIHDKYVFLIIYPYNRMFMRDYLIIKILDHYSIELSVDCTYCVVL